MNAINQSKRLFEVGGTSFEIEVLKSPCPVLVLFWAPWSSPCQKFVPVLDEVAVDCAGRVRIVRINTDDHPYLRLCYEIEFIPTLLRFVDGNESVRIVGIASKETILSRLHLFSRNDQPQIFDSQSK